MLRYIVALLLVVFFASAVWAASINFSAPLPDASHGAGINEQLTIQKTAMAELRTKMQNWATFTGYSARSGR